MVLRGCVPANWPEDKKYGKNRKTGYEESVKEPSVCIAGDLISAVLAFASVAIANEAELYQISQQNEFDGYQM